MLEDLKKKDATARYAYEYQENETEDGLRRLEGL
jgi:hypothetical protein